MNRKLFFLLILSVFSLSISITTLFSQDATNPFYNSKSNRSNTEENQKSDNFIEKSDSDINKNSKAKKSLYEKMMVYKNIPIFKKIFKSQKKYNSKISSYILDYKSKKNFKLLIVVLLFAFFYGATHALTPGHGKNIITAWILSSNRNVSKLLFTSILGMMLHVGTATLMVYTISYIFKGRFSIQSPVFIKYFVAIAFVFIFISALKIIISLIVDIIRNNSKKDRNIKEKSNKKLEKISEETSIKECINTAIMMGIIPCPMATIIIIFMLTQGLNIEGIFVGLSFAIGMASVLFIYSLIILIFKKQLLKLNKNSSNHIFDYSLQFISAILLVISSIFVLSPYL